IVDRNGKVLVSNRTTLALQVSPQKLPLKAERRRAELERLSRVAGMPVRKVRRAIHEQYIQLPSAPAILRKDIPYDIVYYLQEHQRAFPGVAVARIFVRRYPQGTLAAHLFGNVGEITK